MLGHLFDVEIDREVVAKLQKIRQAQAGRPWPKARLSGRQAG